MTFKIYNCDFGFKINGVNYDFEHVKELQGESTQRNRLTRGANAKNTTGLTYMDGLKDPDRWTLPVLALTAELKGVLDGCFKNKTRMDVYAIDRTDGSSKWANQAILSNKPQQLTLDDSAESMDVMLEFESFDTNENHKS